MTDTPSSSNAEVGAPSQALYRRFRAQTFSQIVGQDAVVQTLRNAVRLGRVGHGFLFVGPRGTGKTSMARIMAKAVNCTDLRDGEPCDRCVNCVAIREGRALDVVELDAASNNKVDDMRELLPRVYTGPADLQHKVFIIDEVQRIKEGWDVLLKTLEEPPAGVLFIFCTTDPSQIRPAVVSRLQRFTFRPLAVPEIEGKLQRILGSEGRSVEPEAITLVAQMADGGMRDAESMLDQVLVSADDPITAASIQELLGLADGGLVDGFIDALVGGDVIAGITILDRLESDGRDLVAFSEQLVTRLRAVLVERMSRRNAAERASARPLTLAARRLTGIDASRSGLGGYRWQLELCLLAAAEDGATQAPGATAAASSAAASSAAAPIVSSSPAEMVSPPLSAVPGTDRAGSVAPVASEATPSMVAPTPQSAPATTAQQASDADHDRNVPSTVPPFAPADVAAPDIPTPDAPAPVAAPADVAAPDIPTPIADPDSGPRAAASDARAAEPALPDQDIAEVRAVWPRIVAAIGNNPANRPLVTTCRPVEFRDGFLVLGFPEDQAFMRDIAERKRSTLEDGISSVVGRSVAVRCVVTNLELVEPVDSGEGDLVSQARRIFDGDLSSVEDID